MQGSREHSGQPCDAKAMQASVLALTATRQKMNGIFGTDIGTDMELVR